MLRKAPKRLTWRRNLVYSYFGAPKEVPRLPENLEFAELDVPLTERLFSSEEDYSRRMRYLDFLDKGCRGFVVYEGDSWAAAAWVVPEGTRGMPAHLPRRAKDRAWLFEAHTKPEYRRRGLHRYLLLKRLSLLREENPDSAVIAKSDVNPRNLASRGSHLRAGFQPSGTVTSLRVTLPYVPPGPYGWFNRFAGHPGMPEAEEG